MFWHYALVRRGLSQLVIAMMLLLTPMLVLAGCTVASGGLSFGSYDVFGSSHTESTGAIDVNCDVATPYTIALSPGNGSYSQRAMVNGNHALNYNLYVDAARSLIWGDGGGGSNTVSGNTDTKTQHTVYGRIPASQNVPEGSYADLIVVSVEY